MLPPCVLWVWHGTELVVAAPSGKPPLVGATAWVPNATADEVGAAEPSALGTKGVHDPELHAAGQDADTKPNSCGVRDTVALTPHTGCFVFDCTAGN